MRREEGRRAIAWPGRAGQVVQQVSLHGRPHPQHGAPGAELLRDEGVGALLDRRVGLDAVRARGAQGECAPGRALRDGEIAAVSAGGASGDHAEVWWAWAWAWVWTGVEVFVVGFGGRNEEVGDDGESPEGSGVPHWGPGPARGWL